MRDESIEKSFKQLTSDSKINAFVDEFTRFRFIASVFNFVDNTRCKNYSFIKTSRIFVIRQIFNVIKYFSTFICKFISIVTIFKIKHSISHFFDKFVTQLFDF